MVDNAGLVTRERGDSNTLEAHKLPFCHSGACGCGLVTWERGDSNTLEAHKLPFCHSGACGCGGVCGGGGTCRQNTCGAHLEHQ